jgi:hypothetical protein
MAQGSKSQTHGSASGAKRKNAKAGMSFKKMKSAKVK